MPEIAYVNGRFLPLANATVHVEDRGYQFADAVYEVIRTYGGGPFALDEHLERLWHSMEAIDLRHSLTREQVGGLVREAVRRAGFAETMVYLQVSRGVARRHRGIPAEAAPVLVLTARELPDSSPLRAQGITCVTVPDNRWGRCDIKSVGLLANVMAYTAARQAGANDAIFVEADGTVNEATAGNIFLVTGNVVATPVRGPKLLAGVTRAKILAAAAAMGWRPEERRVIRSELFAADEIFLTSTTAEAVPVLAVDGRPIGTGRPGPVTARLYDQFGKMFVGSPRVVA